MSDYFAVEKIGVIIDNTIFTDNKIDGNNINGPSLIKVPNFIPNKLGNYYLYFGHHHGKCIRMAYSDDIKGPYKLYKKGVLSLNNTPGKDHISSPDVIIKNNKIILYYHTVYNSGYNGQSTFIAESDDGLNFISTNTNISYPYFRYFEYESDIYGIAMKSYDGQKIYKLVN